MSDMNRQGGLALVLVLWMLVLLTIMASSFTLTMRRETALIGHIRDNAQAVAFAEAGIVFTQLMLIHPETEKRWSADGSLYQMSLSDAKIRVQVFDEAGKIDINVADENILRGVFEEAGVDQENQQNIIDAILDWRDEDDLVRLSGAEKDHYQKQGLSYQPTNKNFQTLEELQLVMGISAEIYQEVEPVLTVFSGQQGINPAIASKSALLSFPGVDAQEVENYLFERTESNKNNLPPPDIAFEIKKNSGQSGVYTVIAEAMMLNGAKSRLKAVIKKMRGKDGLPFTTLDWKRVHMGDESFFLENMDQYLIN